MDSFVLKEQKERTELHTHEIIVAVKKFCEQKAAVSDCPPPHHHHQFK